MRKITNNLNLVKPINAIKPNTFSKTNKFFKKNFKKEEKGDIYQNSTGKFSRSHNSSDTCSPDYLGTYCTKTLTVANMANFSHLEEANCLAYMPCSRIMYRYT